jgi:hypothetical protein
VYEVDAVIFKHREPVAYTEVKYHGHDSNPKSFENAMKRAIAQLADLRYSKLPGAAIVPRRRKSPQQSYDARLGAVGCVLVESGYINNGGEVNRDIVDFLDAIQEFATESQPKLLEEYFDNITVRGTHDGLFVPDQNPRFADREPLSDDLTRIAEKYFDEEE